MRVVWVQSAPLGCLHWTQQRRCCFQFPQTMKWPRTWWKCREKSPDFELSGSKQDPSICHSIDNAWATWKPNRTSSQWKREDSCIRVRKHVSNRNWAGATPSYHFGAHKGNGHPNLWHLQETLKKHGDQSRDNDKPTGERGQLEPASNCVHCRDPQTKNH